MPLPVAVSREQDVVHLRLERPHVLNALDPELVRCLTDELRAAVAGGAAVAVISGSGRAFCAGADLNAVTTMDEVAMTSYLGDIQRLADTLRECPLSTIAAVHGAAIGGGLELAVNCDVRIAASDTTFRCPEVDWGLLPTNGSSRLLRDLVGDGWARELMLLGTAVDAHTAARIGLVTRVVPESELLPLAATMAANAARADLSAVRATKRLLNRYDDGWAGLLEAELAELRPLVEDGEYLRRIRAARG